LLSRSSQPNIRLQIEDQSAENPTARTYSDLRLSAAKIRISSQGEMMADSDLLEMQKSKARSKVTNGYLLPGCDGRSTWMRRLRDLIDLHLQDLGGEDAVSEAEKSIVRRACTLTVELERLELVFALAGEAKPEQIDLYQRTANSLRRLLESVGLGRRPRDITPSLHEYIEGRSNSHDNKAPP
jgi:hypothetical protein